LVGCGLHASVVFFVRVCWFLFAAAVVVACVVLNTPPGVVLNIILIFLCFLGAMLIYALMMVSVDARALELGVMRMVGMGKIKLVCMLLCQVWLLR